MKFSKKILLLSLGALVLTGVFLFFYFYRSQTPSFSESQIQEATEEIQKKGLEAFKRRQYSPLVTTLERMVQQYPESVDLKKKLVEAYQSAGDEEKAKQILEEISPSEDKELKQE